MLGLPHPLRASQTALAIPLTNLISAANRRVPPMIDTLFEWKKARLHQREAPLLNERERYPHHGAAQSRR